MQPCWSTEKAFRSDAKTVLKIVGEFLKPFGNQVQVSWFFLLEGKSRLALWSGGYRKMSLRSRQVKNFASAGTRCKAYMELGLWGAKWQLLNLLPRGPELAWNPQSLVSGLVIHEFSRMTNKVGGSHILRVCQSVFEFWTGSCEEWSTVSGWQGNSKL
jgi:hypothetical protein